MRYFGINDFPRFYLHAMELYQTNSIKCLSDLFEKSGYETYRYAPLTCLNPLQPHALGEEEYTLFVLRWS